MERRDVEVGAESDRAPAPQPAASPYEDEIDLLDYVEVLVRRRWTVFCGTLICAVAVLIYGKFGPQDQPEWRAEANVLVPEETVMAPSGQVIRRTTISLNELQRFDIRRKLLELQVPLRREDKPDTLVTLWEYFNGDTRTIRQALDRLAKISEFGQDNAGVITISVTMRDSAVAAVVANGFVNQLIRFQTEEQRKRAQDEVRFIEQRLESVEADLKAAEDSLLAFKRKHRGLPGQDVPLEELEMQLSWLQRRVDARAGLYSNLLNQHEQALLRARMSSPKLQVINYAAAETAEQTTWGLRQKVLLGGATGLVLSVFLAFLAEYVDRNRKSGRLDPIIRELKGSRKVR